MLSSLSFVLSTSLLIYVVLYKNELLSNLYVLLIKVLCFATFSSAPIQATEYTHNLIAAVPRISYSNWFWFGWLTPAIPVHLRRSVCVRMCSLVCLLCNFNDWFHIVFKYYKSLNSPSPLSAESDLVDSCFVLIMEKIFKTIFFRLVLLNDFSSNSLVLDRE